MQSCSVGYILVVFFLSWPANEVQGEQEEIELIDGFPARLPCAKALGENSGGGPRSTDVVQCKIMKDNVTIFNEEIRWLDKKWRAVAFVASSSWNGSKIEVSAHWDGNNKSQNYILNVKTPPQSNCKLEAAFSQNVKARDELTIGCPIEGDLPRNYTARELEDFDISWSRNCENITGEDERYSVGEWEKSRRSGLYYAFGSLVIRNATLESTPGIYKCVVSYRNSKFEAKRWNIKVTAPKPPVIPEIIEQSTNYVVSKGATSNISCSWIRADSIQIDVKWEKSGRGHICDGNSYPCFLEKMSSKPGTDGEQSGRIVKSSLVLSNIGDDDAGLYTCVLETPSGPVSANTSVTVTSKRNVTLVTTACAVVFVCLFLAMVAGAIFNWKRVEILYFYKQKYGRYVKTQRPVTYLIYGDDSYVIDNDRNPVNDLRNWLTTRGLTFCDQYEGKEWSDTGAPIADKSISLLGQCLSLTVVLTPSLLNDNTLELFKTYTGFEENIKKNNFPVVFICTKEFQNRIKKLAKSVDDDEAKMDDSQETYRTVRKFMKRNIVINWCPDEKVRFFRSLYVALPKVMAQKTFSVSDAECELDFKSLPLP